MKSVFSLLPDQASEFARQIDHLYLFISAVSVFFVLLAALLVIVFAVKYRRRPGDKRPEPPHDDSTLEIVAGSGLLVLLMVMFFWGAKLYFQGNQPPKDAMEILVTGKQWMWKLQHPNGKKEINTLHIPVNQAVKLTMTSEDVIHSFYVPAFRVKNDVLPGRYTQVWFQPNIEGTYHLFCAEYCGNEHSRMVGFVQVLSQEGYEKWLLSSGGTAAGAAAATGGGAAQESPVDAGARLFAEYGCATCHHSEAGALGPNLAGTFGAEQMLMDGTSVIADENYLRESILNSQAKIVAGYAPVMPLFQGMISDEEVTQIIAYIKSLSTAGTDG